jgi:replicative DNA helicase
MADVLWHEDAETALLGAMLFSEGAIDHAADALHADDFYLPSHGRLFDRIVRMHSEGKPIDQVTVADEEFPFDQLSILVDSCPTATSAAYYAEQIHDMSIRRKLSHTAIEIQHAAETMSASDAADVADASLQAALTNAASDAPTPMSDLTLMGYDRIGASSQGESRYGVRTRLRTIDDLIGGLEPGTFVILAARPSQGKTSLMLNLMRNIADEHHSALFSLEMTKEELLDRMMCSEAEVALTTYRAGTISEEETQMLVSALPALSTLNLTIDDRSVTLPQVQRRVRRLAARRPLEVIAIDYLQLLSLGSTPESSTQEVTAISRALKLLAKEQHACVLGLSQLSRKKDEGEAKPELDRLRQSGALEQDADVVAFIHSVEKDGPYMKRLIIAKNRNGPTGMGKVRWEPLWTKFSDL